MEKESFEGKCIREAEECAQKTLVTIGLIGTGLLIHLFERTSKELLNRRVDLDGLVERKEQD